uniref:DNA 5'-3' helicase n=1 Tax=Chenopodium quinoa TaxID=63459 RepID=A0A803LRU8_CHEQI
MKFEIEDITVYFPYDHIYPEQHSYMVELKRALDAKGHCLLEMPTGTGKTIALLSLITSYALSKPIKLIYCTRTVHEMEKTLAELKLLYDYQVRHLGPSAQLLAVGLSSRKNLCINPAVVSAENRDSVDAGFRKLTASWVRALAIENPNIPTCCFFENYEKASFDEFLPLGVYTLQVLRAFGKQKGWCPYFLARHMVQFAHVLVCSYQYLLDPKVAGIISEKMQCESVVVFDEAHNIDNVCIEALSVSVRRQTLEGATRNISKMYQEIERFKATDAGKLRAEYNRLVEGLAQGRNLPTHIRGVSQSSLNLSMRECLISPDPILQLSCHDASLAIKPVFERFQTVVITSGTLSPIDLYPRLLNFNPVVSRSFTMSLTRECICPMVLTRGSDQLPVSTKYDMRSDPGVARNYGRLLLEMVSVVPDGIVCFFVSYSYMDAIVNTWNETGILKDIMQHKLVFIETQDVVETTLALDNYRRACDCGRGAVFFSVARGKVAEGIDFDRHYGRLVIMFGIPFQYTLSKYSRHDKRSKLPGWILSHLRDAYLNLSTDMALHIAREFLRKMAQPYDTTGASGRKTLLSQEDVKQMSNGSADVPVF